MPFIPAEVLRESFEVYGKFYEYRIGDRSFIMRSKAKVVRKHTGAKRPDCIVVMINPGSPSPADQGYIYPSHQEKGEFTKMKDNQTQHQMMRLMERMGYDRLDMINLSDICEGNLKKFFGLMGDFETTEGETHSIFSKEREEELKEIIDYDVPIILGWGTDARVKHLAEKALAALGERESHGIEHERHPFYYHPKPPVIRDRLKWLDRMEAQLKGEPVLV